MRRFEPSREEMSRLSRTIAVLAIVWALLLPLATLAASQATTSAWPAAFAYAIYRAGSFLCHQRPERSFQLFATQMPVCARCTGIYLGGAMTAVTSAFVSRRRNPPSPSRARLLLALASLPGLATLIYEWTTGQMPGNALRAMSGVPLGAAIMWIVGRPAASAPEGVVIH